LTVELELQEAGDDGIGPVGRSDFGDRFRTLVRTQAGNPAPAPLPVIPKAPSVTTLLLQSQAAATPSTASTIPLPAIPEPDADDDAGQHERSPGACVERVPAAAAPHAPLRTTALPQSRSAPGVNLPPQPAPASTSLHSAAPTSQLDMFRSMRRTQSAVGKPPGRLSAPPTPPPSPSPPPPEADSDVDEANRRWHVTPADLYGSTLADSEPLWCEPHHSRGEIPSKSWGRLHTLHERYCYVTMPLSDTS
jgi:hypothetical protein